MLRKQGGEKVKKCKKQKQDNNDDHSDQYVISIDDAIPLSDVGILSQAVTLWAEVGRLLIEQSSWRGKSIR